MGCIRIMGGRKLSGSLRIQGSKNAALPMIAGAVLHRGRTVLCNCPHIADVKYMTDIIKDMGGKICWQGENLHLDCTDLVWKEIAEEYAKKMRSSIIFMGAILARFGKCVAVQPGGCVIGTRPIDMHLGVLRSMGATTMEREGKIHVSTCGLAGGDYRFPKVSVGATQQGILAAVTAFGITHLHNCAREPEVQWLVRYLNSRGAQILGEGTEELVIYGVPKLKDVKYFVPPDRIVAGTYLCAGAITRSKITLENVSAEEIMAFLNLYEKMGGQYEYNSGKLVADSGRVGKTIPYVETDTYPGFPTDLQSPLMAVLTTLHGDSCICETIFEDRFKAVEGLRKMGAVIELQDNQARIKGNTILKGAVVEAEELRGAAALVLAGLAAQGETVVKNCEYIQRGYEHICEDLAALGGIVSKDKSTDDKF